MSALFEPTTKTSTSQQQQQQIGSTSGGGTVTSSSTPTLTPQLQQLMQQLLSYSTQDPQAALQPIRASGLQQINQAYSTVPGQVTQQLAKRGYGSSGSMGDSLYRTGLARAGAVSGLEGQLANSAIQQGQFGAGLSERLLEAMRGNTSTSTESKYGTEQMSGTRSGTETQPGPSIFGSIAGLFSTLAGLGTGTVGGGLLGSALKSLGGGGGGGSSSAPNSSWGGNWGDFGNEFTGNS